MAVVSEQLLAWYDRHARILPWRSPPGTPARDPYAVWLSEVMLQQTTVAAVKPYFTAFLNRWPTVTALAAAEDAEVMSAWAGLGYYSRARNLLACARKVREHGGFPATAAELRQLPGIGDYTAAAIAAIAFGEPAVVVDANVERVIARLFAIDTPLPGAKPLIRARAAELTPAGRPGDHAQAMMDLGATICTPRRPACGICPLRLSCAAFAQGRTDELPLKMPKAAKPHRHGFVFWAEADDRVLLVTRPSKGLLGGMRALPTGIWGAEPSLSEAPVAAEWVLLDEPVRHVFTHFSLELRVAVARTERTNALEGEWWPISHISDAGLPTVFDKAARRAMEHRMTLDAAAC